MRILKFVALAALGLALVACHKKPEGEPAAKAHDLSAASNASFLAEYAARKDVHKTPDGLLYRVIKSGNGATAQTPDDMVSVYYKGSLIDGKVFDQTDPGQPRTFPVGRLIPGWVEALMQMKEGDEWELVIPSNLAYGPSGAGDAVPPDQVLVFDMTLLKVQKAP